MPDDKSPAFRFYARDFLTSEKQSDMSLQEAGVYIRLMCHCWLNGSLPDGLSKLAQRAGATAAQMRKLWPAVSKCFELRDGRWYHPRLDAERVRQSSYQARQSSNGKKGGRPLQKETQAFSESPPELVKIESYKNPLANANANESVVGSSGERGLEKTPPMDLWFEKLKQLYPQQRVTSGSLTMKAFVDVLLRGKSEPEATFGRMLSNLGTQKRGHEWRVKGMVPSLQKWLESGAWEQVHEEAPASTLVNEKSARTLTSGAAFVAGGEK